MFEPEIKNKRSEWVFMILSGIFLGSLTMLNILGISRYIHFTIHIFKLELPVMLFIGILPYPITFLITDIISEVYGKKKANQIVTAGIFASVFSLLIVYVANAVPAIENSPVTNELFTKVFGQTALAVIASMIAYLAAQYIDIYIFHFWKRVTKGKMLWLRNNFSTFTSQFVDTFTVLFLLCNFEILPWNLFSSLLLSGFLFKVLIAILDTPVLYAAVFLFQRRFHLKRGEELNLD
jgi:uncharacterized integral membrane protein (TIGR00697 family)